jgi:hypothetical protein
MGDKANTGDISDQAEALAGLEDALPVVDDAELVLEWRLEQLERAGYEGLAAVELAERRDVDLHAALRLVARGCVPALAAQILL